APDQITERRPALTYGGEFLAGTRLAHHGIHLVAEPSAAHRDVSPLAEQPIGSEHESPVSRQPLRDVTRKRVGVLQRLTPGDRDVEEVSFEDRGVAREQADGDRSRLWVRGLNDPAVSIDHTQATRAAAHHDTIAARKRRLADRDLHPVETTGGGHQHA